MYPHPLFELFGLPVALYGLITIVSGLAGIGVALYLGRARGLAAAHMLDGLVPGILAAYVADRLSQAANLLFHTGVLLTPGMVSVPAALGTMGVIWARRRAGGWRDALDAVAPALALAHGMSRFACLANGCCHGKPAWGLPWAIVFADPAADCIYHGIPVHPTQIYEAAGNLALGVVLLWLRRRPALRGRLLWVYLAAYGALRFIVEFSRGDPRAALGPLTLNQFFCLGWMALGGAMLARRPRADPA
jgi:phosphatidylglycerol:prolipoprotein diacylglycerol transferase